MNTIHVGACAIRIEGNPEPFTLQTAVRELSPGLHVLTLTLTAAAPASPPQLRVAWSHPDVDIAGQWHSKCERNRGKNVNWGGGMVSRSTSQAPVISLFSASSQNRLTFACADALNSVELTAGVVEETAEFACHVKLFAEPHPPVASYETQILFDTRPIAYHEALAHVSDWWASRPDYRPAPVPEIARLPMYSSWYSFHQRLDVPRVLDQCRLAKSLGCEAIIIDDGWQTNDSNRGYAFCGDWNPDRIPDMRGFVEAVHGAGLKFLLWYSVPHMGKNTKHFEEFKHKLLHFNNDSWQRVGYMDPRFPEVREYLIALYERHLREWNLDGFKLDFVDAFNPSKDNVAQTGGGRDYDSVPQAVDRLLSDVMARLRAIKPDIMIEFRQSYIGPLMRKYGNMFRSGDCPADAITNRVHTLDIRLLAGKTATHADMFMWHPGEPVESAARQILGTLFAVPQVSVLLDRLRADHLDMLRFYLAFWREHRDVLLDGRLAPLSPELLFPQVIASTAAKRVVALYDAVVATPGSAIPADLMLVNASASPRVAVDILEPLDRRLQVFTCTGRKVRDESVRLPAGLHALPIPISGLARLTAR